MYLSICELSTALASDPLAWKGNQALFTIRNGAYHTEGMQSEILSHWSFATVLKALMGGADVHVETASGWTTQHLETVFGGFDRGNAWRQTWKQHT